MPSEQELKYSRKRVKKIWVPIVTLFFLLIIPQAVLADEWPQLNHDAQHTAWTPDSVGSDWQLKWLWNNSPGSDHLFYPFDVQPITGDGKLYLGVFPNNDFSRGRLIALYEDSGQEAWHFDVPSPIRHTAAYDNGYVYFATENGTVYQLSSAAGQLVHSRQLNGNIYASPVLANNRLYLGTTSGYFYALNKTDLQINWHVSLGAEIRASAGYSPSLNLVIVPAEDMNVYGLNGNNGVGVWTTYLGGYNRISFNHSFPVVADLEGAVILRTDLLNCSYAFNLLLGSRPGTTIEEIRSQIQADPRLETFFVLNLSNGQKRYTAPVMYSGAEEHCAECVGGQSDFGRDIPAQAVIKKISSAQEAAYLIWRNGQVSEWPRSDATFGEMDLATGNIRFVGVDQGVNRLLSDEHSTLSMAGDVFFNNNWQALGAQRINRSAGGNSFSQPVPAQGIYVALNSLWDQSSCAGNANHFCTQTLCAPPDCPDCDSKKCFRGPGFFMYTNDRYSRLGLPLELGCKKKLPPAVISGETVYYKHRDGTIMAISTSGQVPTFPPTSTPAPTNTPLPTPEGAGPSDAVEVLVSWSEFLTGNPDFSGDGKVNGLDIGYVVKNWL